MDELEVKEEEKVSGETLTPSEEIPATNGEPEPTEEQVEEAEPEQDLSGIESEPNEMVEEEIEKLLTQSQVNELIGRTRTETREKAIAEAKENFLKEMYNKYGVNDDNELDTIFGRGQAYDVLSESYTSQGNQLRDIMAENALLKSGISQTRWDDAKAILGAKGLDITQENIISELATHPEWSGGTNNAASASTQPLTLEMAEGFTHKNATENEIPSKIRKLGSEVQPQVSGEDEETRINKLFGIN